MITWQVNTETKQAEILHNGTVIDTCPLGDLISTLQVHRARVAREIRTDQSAAPKVLYFKEDGTAVTRRPRRRRA